MTSLELKQELHGYIEQADDEILKAIKTLVKPIIINSSLTQDQKEELNKRKEAHLSGTSKSYSWEQTMQLVKTKRK